MTNSATKQQNNSKQNEILDLRHNQVERGRQRATPGQDKSHKGRRDRGDVRHKRGGYELIKQRGFGRVQLSRHCSI